MKLDNDSRENDEIKSETRKKCIRLWLLYKFLVEILLKVALNTINQTKPISEYHKKNSKDSAFVSSGRSEEKINDWLKNQQVKEKVFRINMEILEIMSKKLYK